ncbi:LysM peptidoglycan-binding domain-containing protein [Bacillus lacus]|uniref:LysM peptidoglycan-binding domain-containing protein n=1 Tax=Metabacillus lacus TaxID=1983721 RepID=A0A7X2J0A7_9BACI|nr:LysM peptidoglycan-binding domain-containing protein [Metabacillus lacus]MRX73082.1 LysM peptidoglycan-binding domain-containing protein [Metabacillus lacus]
MKKTIFSIAAVAALSTAGVASAQAEQIVVNKGDTLWSISQQHGTSVQEIKDLNGLTSDLILPNSTLTISSEEVHTVVSGDTLWSISEKYGVSVDSIYKLNNLSSDLIIPGQTLTVKGSQAAAKPQEQAKPKAEQKKKAQVKDQNPAVNEASANAVTETSVKSEQVAKEFTVTATAYTAYCNGCSGTTATGDDLRANPDKKVIAVDPKVIPLGSKVYVEGYGYATASDTGGAIKGNKIDVFIPSQDAAMAWGKRSVNIKVLN